jgi:hypothetical protein
MLGRSATTSSRCNVKMTCALTPLRASRASASTCCTARSLCEARRRREVRAMKAFASLNRMNLFALSFRTNNMKTPAGRARKIAVLVDLLARGEVIVPMAAGRQAIASSSIAVT